MSKHAKIKRSQKLFLAAIKKKFSEDPDAPTTKPPLKHVEQEHVTLIPKRQCKPDPFDEEADIKYDKMINAVDDWELRGYRRK